MLLAFWLFQGQLIHVVSITFTTLILTELLMVALTIRTWHGLMLLAELSSIAIYILSLVVLHDYFGEAVLPKLQIYQSNLDLVLEINIITI